MRARGGHEQQRPRHQRRAGRGGARGAARQPRRPPLPLPRRAGRRQLGGHGHGAGRAAELRDADGRPRVGRAGRARGDGPGPAAVDRARRAAASAGPARRRAPGGLRRLSAPAARARRRARAPGAPAAARGGRRGVAARVRRLVRRAARLRVCVRLARARAVPDGLGAPRHALGVVARPARRPPRLPELRAPTGPVAARAAVRDARRPHAVPPPRWRRRWRGTSRPPRSGHRKRPAGSRRRRTRRGRGRPPLLPSTGVRRPVPLCSSAFLPTLPPLRRSTC